MKYISRHFEKIIDYALNGKVVLITGPRQVGKTKIITECYKNFNYVTLDEERLNITNQLNDAISLNNNHPKKNEWNSSSYSKKYGNFL